jgi:hypothetical protein
VIFTGRRHKNSAPVQEKRQPAPVLRREPHGLPLIRAIGKNTDMLTH